MTEQAKTEDTVRVIRILEYVGPRSWVEKTLQKSAIQGTKDLGGDGRALITSVILGTFPEIVKKAESKNG